MPGSAESDDCSAETCATAKMLSVAALETGALPLDGTAGGAMCTNVCNRTDLQ